MKTTSLSLLALLLLSACGDAGRTRDGGAGDEVPENQRQGGTVVVATIGDIPDISPLTSTDHTSNQIQQFVLFTPLVAYDENFQPVPRFARSWDLAPDGSSLTFHLRDDLFWHDGVKTTAYDVKFSYDRARNPETGFPNTAFWDHYGEATVVDSFTIRIAMEPQAEPLDPWRAFAPAPRHILEDVAPAQLKQHPFATSAPVGNGPFRFVSRAPGQNWVFEANPDFPQELGGRPYADRIVYRYIPEPTTLLSELLNGTVHYYIAPTADQVPLIERSANARVLDFDDRSFVLIGWNQRNPLFADAEVRRALTMGINRQEVVDAIRRGYGTLGNSTVPPFYWNHAEGIGEDLAHNPEEAAAILRRAGWEDRNGDGMLENAEGRPFRFTLVTNHGNKEREEIAQIVQAQLRRLGIDVQTQVLEWGSLLSRINDTERRNFEALLIGWVTEFRIDDKNLFHCDRQNEPYQWVSHCNRRLDALIDTLPLIMDRDQARPLWREYQELLAQDQPYTILFFTRRIEGVHNALRNVHVDARGDWVSVAQWYLHPDHRGRARAAAAAPTDTQP
jgi:peptide/nickel transport system substrate-binding protein